MRHATADKKSGSRRKTLLHGTIKAAAGLVTAVVAFVLYLRTLAPTVLYYDYPDMRDASALQVKASILGIPDVTGYPTYTLLTHLFTYLPFEDPAYRVNLTSAVFGAGAVFLVYLVCLWLTDRITPSIAGALLFGVSETFWSQAVIAEVYTLNALFVGASVFVLLVWRDKQRDRYLLVFAFFVGLSLTHHLTSGLLLPAGLLFVLLVDRGRLTDWMLVLKGVGFFLLGLLPYLYLPVRAAMDFTRWTISVDPTLMRYDPSTFEGFVTLVTGGDFKGAMFVFGPAELSTRVVYYLGYLLEQFHPGLLAVTLLGIVYLFIEDRAAVVLLGFLYLGWLFYALEYDISDVYYQFIPTYLILAIFTAAGFAGLLSTLEELMASRSGRVRVVAVVLSSAAVVLTPFVGISETYAETDRSEDYEGRRAIEAVATKTEPGTTIIHHRSPLWYMHLVEGRRSDVKLVASFHLTLDDREIEAAKAALETSRAYILYPSTTDSDLMREAGLDLVPVEAGVLYEVVPRGAESRDLHILERHSARVRT